MGDLTQGALTQVLNEGAPSAPADTIQQQMQKLMLSRIHTPEQMQQREGARQSALGEYQNALRAEPYGDYTPSTHGLYSWIGGMGGGSATAALTGGIAAGGKMLGDIEQAKRANEIEARRVGYNDAAQQAKLDMGELSMIKSMAGGRAGTWQAKTLDDGSVLRWNTGTGEEKVVPATHAKAWFAAKQEGYKRAVDQQHPDPEQYSVDFADHAVKSAPVPSTPRPGTLQRPGGGVLPADAAAAPNDIRTLEKIRDTVEKPSLQYKDPAEEARAKTFEVDTEAGATKHYNDNIVGAANVAESTLNNIATLRAVPRTQDAFAPYREKLGSAMDAMGLKGQMAREAESLQQVRPILAKIANDRLLLAKGVQTEGDATRAFNEFVKISDTQAAADFMYAWGEELANRAKFKREVYDSSAAQNRTHRRGEDMWKKTDYADAFPVALLPDGKGNTKAWAYTDWRNKTAAANPDADLADIRAAWNKLARGR